MSEIVEKDSGVLSSKSAMTEISETDYKKVKLGGDQESTSLSFYFDRQGSRGLQFVLCIFQWYEPELVPTEAALKLEFCTLQTIQKSNIMIVPTKKQYLQLC